MHTASRSHDQLLLLVTVGWLPGSVPNQVICVLAVVTKHQQRMRTLIMVMRSYRMTGVLHVRPAGRQVAQLVEAIDRDSVQLGWIILVWF